MTGINATLADSRLSALDSLARVDRQELVLELPLDCIVPDPDQPRTQFSEATLQELTENLSRLGQIHPVEVREAGERYVLIDGERRWRAAQRVPLPTLRALLRLDPGTPDDVRDRQFAANYHRDAMALIDQARYLQARIERLGSVAAVSQAIGLSVPRVLNIVKTLRAEGAAARLRDSGLTKDADTIGAVVEVQKHDPAAADALVDAAMTAGRLTRADAQEAARLAKGRRYSRVDDDEAAKVRSIVTGTPAGEPPTALTVWLACECDGMHRARWNKLSREHGRARLSLTAATTQPGCVLVAFGDRCEPFPVNVLRILEAVYDTGACDAP